MHPVIIFGTHRVAKLALEIFHKNKIIVYGFLDDNDKLHGTEINFIPVLGNTEDKKYLNLLSEKCHPFVALEHYKERDALIKFLNKNKCFPLVNAIHPSAQLAQSSKIEKGNLIDAHTTVGPDSIIGQHNILHANVVIGSDVHIGDLVHIGAGAVIGAGTKIENGAFIGSGAVINPGLTIGKNAQVGLGTIVLQNVIQNTTVLGNPAKQVTL